jgi:cytochrome c oxidase cbb3-type subunit 2
MMSIKTVNALSHYTDWTIGHVHSGALGWNGMSGHHARPDVARIWIGRLPRLFLRRSRRRDVPDVRDPRPFRDEVERYGHYSLAAESIYDHPFQWGSKRTGPDLARVGGKYSDEWHVQHLTDPRSVVPESIMPPYAFLKEHELKAGDMTAHLTTLADLGVPYSKDDIAKANADLLAQADPEADSADLLKRYPKAQARDFDGDPKKLSEMDALVAYLQMLGTLVDFKAAEGQEKPR